MSVFTLKVIALILMIIDHIGNFFPQVKGVLIMRILGRLVAPIFFYMLVEGFVHTSNRKKYANRLLIFAGIMIVGNFILETFISNNNLPIKFSINPLCPNIFLSMYLGVIILGDLENIRVYVHKTKDYYSNTITSIVRMIICIILSLDTEASIYGLFMIFIFYLLRENRLLKTIIYILGTIIICVIENNSIQVFMLFSIFLLLFYNGEKGYSSKNSKYFFYIFYMVHIWALCLISLFIM